MNNPQAKPGSGIQVNISHGTGGPSPEKQTHVMLVFNLSVDRLAFTPAEAVDVARKMLENAKRLDPKSVSGWMWPTP